MTKLNLQKFNCLQDALFAFLNEHTDKTALIEVDRDREKQRLSYHELQKQSVQFQNKLHQHRCEPSKRMAIIMSNQSKWLISAIGLFYTGAALVPLDYKLTPEDQLSLLEHSGATFLVTEFPFWKRLKSADTKGLLQKIKTFVTEAPEKEILDGAERWEFAETTAGSFPVSQQRDDVACIVYSSGTGGTPKGCMLTHGNYLSQAQCLADMYPIEQKDTYFSFIPTNHAIDFMCGFLLPLFFGSKIVHQRTLRPEFFASTIQAYEVSHMALVPLLLKNLEQKIRDKFAALPPLKRKITNTLIAINALVTKNRPWYAFSRWLLAPIHKTFGGHLRFIFAGGAFVESSTAQFFYDLGIPVVIGYGLTEAGTVLTVNDLKPFRSDTVGKPLSITNIDIRNADETGIGEVWAHGPTVMKGYVHADDLTRETIENGWLRTGDLGKWSHGHLVLMGRKKNMIVTPGGKNVYPEDVETAFDRMDDVEEYCVLAKRLIWPSESLSQDSMILIVRPKDGKQPQDMLEEIRKRNRKLSDYKRVSEVLWWNHPFHRTASMKIKRIPLADDIAKSTSNQSAVSL